MKVVLQLALGIAIAIAISSCWVDRKSSDFACTTDQDCVAFSPTRRCDVDLGYCVPGDNAGACPDQCNGACDMAQKSCTIMCQGNDCTGEVECPDGWTCTINCAAGACDSIRCRPGADCTINCNGGSACGNIECGDGDCKVSCTGGSACGTIDCNDSKCDVTCNGGNACPRVECDNACRCDVACTTGGSCGDIQCPDAACDVSPNGCDGGRTNCPTTCGT